MPSEGSETALMGDVASTARPSAPGAVLFVCNRNSIRSPMAEAIAERVQQSGVGPRTYVDSAGIDPMDVNGIAIRSLSAWGIELERHVSKSLEDIDFGEFDVVVSLATTARDFLNEHCELGSATHLFWELADPNEGGGTPDERLAAFDQIRDHLSVQIRSLLGR